MENNKIENKILYRSNTNRVIFGVCGGLGEYFKVDPIIFRIIFLLLTVGAGSGVLIYLILAFLIPRNPSTIPAQNEAETINVKERLHELAQELRELKNLKGGERHRRRGGIFRLFIGLIVLTVGFGMLAQNLNLIPGFYFNFSYIWNFWPILVVLLGFSIIARGL